MRTDERLQTGRKADVCQMWIFTGNSRKRNNIIPSYSQSETTDRRNCRVINSKSLVFREFITLKGELYSLSSLPLYGIISYYILYMLINFI